MAREIDRRRFLISACGVAVAGCSHRSVAQPDAESTEQETSLPTDGGEVADGDPPPVDAPLEAKPMCGTPADGSGLDKCGVPKKELRVPGGATLAVGEVLLMSLTDRDAAIVARDAGGFYALSAACTHECCTVSLCKDAVCGSMVSAAGACSASKLVPLAPTGTAFVCACHGSEFSAGGAVLQGPAKDDLPALALRIDGDDVIVDLSRSVPAATRV